ncbi:MAG: methyltransferase domain-containing protein [Candidatus Micrarchaeota archaeon]
MVDKKKLYRFGMGFFAGNEKREEEEIVELFEQFKVPKDAVVLETGLGTGRFISIVKHCFPKTVCFGTDVVPDFVNNKIKGVELSLQSAEKLSFKNGFFDVVLCIDVLHHVPDREAALQELGRVTKKGGLVLFRDIRPVHSADKIRYRLIDMSCLAYNSNLPRYFKKSEWPKKLKAVGLSIIHTQKFDSQLDWIVCQKAKN